MDPVHSPGRASVVAILAEDFAGQIEFVDLSYAPDIQDLIRPGRDAE